MTFASSFLNPAKPAKGVIASRSASVYSLTKLPFWPTCSTTPAEGEGHGDGDEPAALARPVAPGMAVPTSTTPAARSAAITATTIQSLRLLMTPAPRTFGRRRPPAAA